LTQSYFNELASQYPGGITVILSGGTKYEMGVINLSASTKIVTGLSLAGNAIVEVNGNFAIAAGTSVDSLVFENIVFTEHSGSPKTAANFGGRYLFNFNQAGAKASKLTIRNCDIRYKRGNIRAQVATEISTVTIENCLFDSIGGYGIVNADHAEAYFDNVVVKNSTIAHAEKIFVASKPTRTTVSLTVENVTVCYAPKGEGNYIIDYNGQTVPGGVTLKNCVFGIGWGSKIRGMRASNAVPTIDKSYRASDLEWTTNDQGVQQSPLSDLENLNATTTAIFQDPDKVNFKVTNATLAGKIGDPRWW
ncbi:MAG: DUF5123 domain-containing protein, partial [Bacteroidales bacterium]|nr:DUF5123 domain-containing protein [Bacteroidales bacterium]